MMKERITVRFKEHEGLQITRHDDLIPAAGVAILVGLVLLGAYFWLPLWLI